MHARVSLPASGKGRLYRHYPSSRSSAGGKGKKTEKSHFIIKRHTDGLAVRDSERPVGRLHLPTNLHALAWISDCAWQARAALPIRLGIYQTLVIPFI